MEARVDRKAIDLRGFVKSSLNEWEGRIAAVVWTAGCNWRCPFCHAGPLVTAIGELPRVRPEDVFAHLERQGDWIDGVAVTGGEPTLQPGLVDFIRELKRRGAAVKLETNGTAPRVIEALLRENLLDCLCLDYKAPLDERLGKAIGVPLETATLADVRASFALAKRSRIEREYHTTLCPAVIDEGALEAMAKTLEPEGPWVLQQYETRDVLNVEAAGEKRYDQHRLERLEGIARAHHRRVLLRRGTPA